MILLSRELGRRRFGHPDLVQMREPQCLVEFADPVGEARRDAVFLESLAGREAPARAEHDGRPERVALRPREPLAAVVVDDLDVLRPEAAQLTVGDIPAGAIAPRHDAKVVRGVLLGEIFAV